MISRTSVVFRLGAVLALLGTASFALPMNALASVVQERQAEQAAKAKVEQEKLAKIRPSRDLLGNDLKNLKGKFSQNPYLSGSAKWGINVDGVDVTTGNLTLSSTDLSFEGGYGIPVNMTRTYSANNPDDGPLGFGWTLSVDLRSTAGGLLKNGGAPVRSVPVTMKERPSDQPRDPNTVGMSGEPVSAMMATDAGGTEVTMQRDVDGIVMPPGWDQNVIETVYENVTVDSNEHYQIALSQTITTPEGTVYEYVKHGEHVRQSGSPGSYTYAVGGLGNVRDQGQSNSTREPSNILKIASVTDRHGNPTTYSYDDGWVYYKKANGWVREHRLETISMPGGRSLYFEYADSGASPYLAKVKDAVSSGREVGYVVTGGYLVEVESAGGKTTEYDYAQAQLADSDIDVLTKVTDPRGLETSFLSCAAWVETPMGYAGTSIYTYLIAQPTGLKKRISLFSMTGSDTDLGDDYSAPDELPVITSALVGVTVDGNGSFPPSSTSGYDALTSYGWDLTPSAGLIDLLDVPNGDDDFYDPQAFVYMGAVRLDPGGLSNHNPPRTQKVYSSETQNLIYDGSFGGSEDSESYGGGTLLSRRGTGKLSWYNFRGQPLRELVYEGLLADSTVHVRDMVTDYAYWGKDKYFQQKAVRGPYDFGTTSPSNIRYSWTDYYDSSAADGKKGQTKRVYRSGIDSNVSNEFEFYQIEAEGWEATDEIPNNLSVSNVEWKRTIRPDGGIHAAEFDYDSDGRAISVEKLQKVVTGTPAYVETTTVYGSTGSPTWGMPTSVTEADGTADERTTTTEEYDQSGRALIVEDANGRKLKTTYDDDGLVQSVELYNGVSYDHVVQNVYDSETGELQDALDYGQGGEQYFTYAAGQVTSVTTATANDFHTVVYEYDNFGRRKSMRTQDVATPRKFEYRDYVWVGMPGQEQPIFTNMVECVWDDGEDEWVPSAEEYSYSFEESGRLLTARFAPTPTANDWDGTSRSWYGDNPWGDPGSNSMRPSSYASQRYCYDDSGRLTHLVTEWNTWETTPSPGWDVSQIRSANYTYSGDFMLRTGFTLKNQANSTMFSETYGYHSKLDYLTSASYSDDSGSNGTWTYDAAGNRANAGYVYDNLNRMIETPLGARTFDAVGNQLFGGPSEMDSEWDHFNRMIYSADNAGESAYYYLPNGLRSTQVINKVEGWYEWYDLSGFYDTNEWMNEPTKRWRYDGQMTLEEDATYDADSDTMVDEMRYTLGARGMESIVGERVEGHTYGGVTLNQEYRSFPVYDGHGNMIASLERDGTDDYILTNEKRYDAWGMVRAYDNNGGIVSPSMGFCANLGHIFDQESGLIYMRARYYDPSAGRFISEDPVRSGMNWFVYCSNDPVNRYDLDGREDSVSASMRNALLQLMRGSPDEMLALLETLTETLGKQTALNLSRTILNSMAQASVKSRPFMTPQQVANSSACSSLMARILDHIDKIVKDPNSVTVTHWLHDIKVLTENFFKAATK